MTTLHLLFMVMSALIYVITTRAYRERRAPAAAIAWVVGLLTLPYLMLPLYLLFGRRKLPRIPRQARKPPMPVHWATETLAAFGLDPPGDADIRFHADGVAARDALWSVVAHATRRLDIVTFLVGDDEIGRELVRRVSQRVEAGVEVRVLIDGVGALLKGRVMRRLLLRAGADVRLFHPPLRLKVQAARNLRNHRKFVIADGEWIWSGGRNLAVEYFADSEEGPAWLDLSFDLAGAPVSAASSQFADDWGTTKSPRTPSRHARPAEADAGGVARAESAPRTMEPGSPGRAQFVPSGPDQTDDTLNSILIAGAYRAEREILIATPYFIPDDGLRTAIRLAALRGVRVTIVIPQRSNHRLADWARNRTLRELAGAGVRVCCTRGMLHAKAAVIDDSVAMCGSANTDVRSLLLNYEASVLFYDMAQIEWLRRWIQDVARDGMPYDAQPPGVFRDIGEGLLLAIAFEL